MARSCPRILCAAFAFSAAFLVRMPAGHAQQPSAPCDPNSVALALTSDATVIRPGATINYTVTVSNLSRGPQPACHVSDATITLTLPARDGTPTGQRVVVATGYALPAGTPPTQVGTVPYTVDVEPGVTRLSATVEFSGVTQLSATVEFSGVHHHEAPATITETAGPAWGGIDT